MKKKYNPFLMWGSLVGAVLALLLEFIPSSDTGIGWIHIWIAPLFKGLFEAGQGILFFIMVWVTPIILGFLLGWCIHALIRRLKR